jgi:hypothetical protein
MAGEAKRLAGKRVAIVDDEVIAAANEHGIAMIFTGMRPFDISIGAYGFSLD